MSTKNIYPDNAESQVILASVDPVRNHLVNEVRANPDNFASYQAMLDIFHQIMEAEKPPGLAQWLQENLYTNDGDDWMGKGIWSEATDSKDNQEQELIAERKKISDRPIIRKLVEFTRDGINNGTLENGKRDLFLEKAREKFGRTGEVADWLYQNALADDCKAVDKIFAAPSKPESGTVASEDDKAIEPWTYATDRFVAAQRRLVYHSRDISAMALKVYLCLLGCIREPTEQNPKGRPNPNPSQILIGQWIGIKGTKQVRTYIRELESKGYLTVKHNRKKEADSYTLHKQVPPFKGGK